MRTQDEFIRELRAALSDLERVAHRVGEFAEKARLVGDDAYWDAVAFNLHGFYSGVERVFEDVARTIDQNVPSGPAWHSELLTQMSAEIDKTRPAVISLSTKARLAELLSFRHLARNIYAFNLRSSRLDALAKNLPDCFAALQNDLLKFISFLESI